MANEANEGGGKNEAKVAEKGDLIGFPVPALTEVVKGGERVVDPLQIVFGERAVVVR